MNIRCLLGRHDFKRIGLMPRSNREVVKCSRCSRSVVRPVAGRAA